MFGNEIQIIGLVLSQIYTQLVIKKQSRYIETFFYCQASDPHFNPVDGGNLYLWTDTGHC